MQFNKICAASIIACSICVAKSSVMAQDSPARSRREYGVNRRVVSPYGYGGVSGTFAEPNVSNLQIVIKSGKMIGKDVPQMYFGISSKTEEVDSGLTWEKLAGYTPVEGTQAYTTQGIWTMFYRPRGGKYAVIRGNFYLPIGGVNSIDIDFYLHGKDGVLDWTTGTSSGNFVYPLTNPPTKAGVFRVKRLTALTQRKALVAKTLVNYNGAAVTGVAFSNGRVAPLRVAAGQSSIGTFVSWKLAVDNYKKTSTTLTPEKRAALFAPHYFPKGRKGASRSSKVPFVIITSPARQSNGRPPATTDLFDAETVDIEVGSLPKRTGKPVKKSTKK